MSVVPDSYGRQLITRFEKVVREHAFKGAGHPEDALGIEARYAEAKRRLQKRFDEQALNLHDARNLLQSAEERLKVAIDLLFDYYDADQAYGMWPADQDVETALSAAGHPTFASRYPEKIKEV